MLLYIALNPLHTASGTVVSGLFVFRCVQWEEREKATTFNLVTYLLSSFSFSLFFFFTPLFPSPPALLCRYLFPRPRVVFARETAAVICFVLFCPCNNNSYLLRVVLSVQQVSVPLLQRVCCSSCSLSFPIFSHHILPNTYLSFVLLCIVYSLESRLIVFLLFSFFSWSGLFRCVLVPGTLAFFTCFTLTNCDGLVYFVSQSVTTEFVSLSDEEPGLRVY